VPLVYLDTNVFIRGFEYEGSEAHAVQQLVNRLKEAPKAAVTSELTLAELLAPSKQANAIPFADRLELYGGLLIWSGFIDLRPVSRAILLETAALRHQWSYKLPDAIHVASAVDARCKFFMSNDKDTRRLPPGLHSMPANQAGVETVLEALGV